MKAIPLPIERPRQPIARPRHNCWRVEHASRVGFIVDGEDYYRALADAFARAERSIAIVGWDVNTRACLVGDGAAEGLPRELGPMLDALVRRRRRLHIWVLEWDFPMLYALDRELLPIVKFGWRTHRRVHFRLDANHPIGGSHHQKVVVIDDKVAFVGGMDVTHGRWDTCDHHPDDERRTDPWGRSYAPYHDVMVVCDGAAAAALGALTRARWKRAGGRRRKPVYTHGDPWPASVRSDVEDVEVAIARTEPPYRGRPLIAEVANAWLDMVRTAKRSIYIENQYLTSAAFGDALVERLTSEDCPEIVIVLTHSSTGWLEQVTMGVMRARLIERLRKADRCDRLRVYYVCAGTVDVKMHSKLIVVDDQIVRIGSANLNNRSMGFDTECDVFIEACGRADVSAAIVALRDRLLGEHLGVEPAKVHAAIEHSGSLAAAIEALRGGEHTLVPLEIERDSWIDVVIPDTTLIDPERPVGMSDLLAELAPEHPASLRESVGATAIAVAEAAGVMTLLGYAVARVFRWCRRGTTA
jgi:phospholipase D1/2